jgi:NADH-ubiquinone oxidoreductase chain 5
MVLFIEWELYSYNSITFIITILFDWISLVFIGFVLIISSIVIFYSTNYMKGDINLARFIWLVFLFVLSIVLLIISPNIIRILLGWDGLGLVSYCLVIYYQNIKSSNAGILTILSNRVGDVAILLCISWLFNYGGWNFYYLPYIFTKSELGVILSLVVLAALTKRAQIPFSAWLPAAIAAPTPVSSLVHSSTLVTAGVYLLIRFSSLIGVSIFLLIISVWTILISGVNANLEIDFKKTIALSTLSQLGVIIMTISLGLVELAFFHLLSHALFKSLLFLCAGVFIHGLGDIQDVRDLGGVGVITPVTSLYFFGCSLSLCGFPFLSGFYSKDIIIEIYFIVSSLNYVFFFLILTSILLTTIYSTRLFFFLFIKPSGFKKINNLRENLIIIGPISLLFYSSVMGGSLMIWWFSPPILVVLTLWFRGLILALTLILFYLAFYLTEACLGRVKIASVKSFLGNIINLVTLSTSMFIPIYKSGALFIKQFDQGWLEYMGGQGFIGGLVNNSVFVDKFNVLNLKLYLTLFIILILLCLLLCLNSLF